MSSAPNNYKSYKPGDVSDLFATMKRNTSLAVERSKDAGMKQKILIKRQGFNGDFLNTVSKRGLDSYNAYTTYDEKAVIVTGNTSVPVPAVGTFLGSIRVLGYTVGTITPADIDAFKLAFASRYNISPSLITITLSPGSLGVSVSSDPIANVSTLSPGDKSFLANSGAIINSISTTDVSDIISSAAITPYAIQQTGPLSIDPASTVINPNATVASQVSSDPTYAQNLITSFSNPYVADTINNCMYTLIAGPTNDLVIRINVNGTADTICNYVENRGCRQIFINNNSTYLIIPSNVDDTTSPNAMIPSAQQPNKVYLVNISTGVITTVTLTDLSMNTIHGFDKTTQKYYYSSAMASNYNVLCCVTIPSNYSSETVSPNQYFSNIPSSAGKMEFINSVGGYIPNAKNIQKFDLTATNGSVTVIAGYSGIDNGSWSNTNTFWYSATAYGPYLDAPIGTDAFFSQIQDICIDTARNRLLVVDYGAQRIRSIELSGSYPVTTLAGTSPTFSGLAINSATSSFSQGYLSNLDQVGLWGVNNMPPYTRVNGLYSESTFNNPEHIVLFNSKIYVTSSSETRQLSNGNVNDFSVTKNAPQTIPVVPSPSVYENLILLLARIRVAGYTVSSALSALQLATFKAALSIVFGGVNPDLLVLEIPTGPFTMDVSVDYNKVNFNFLNDNDKSFFCNSDSILSSVTPDNIASVVAISNTNASITSIFPPVPIVVTSTLENTTITGESLYKLKTDCSDDFNKRKSFTQFRNPFVGDSVNNCMYTIVGSDVVKVLNNGTIKRIADFPGDNGCRFIFINSASTHLIIPYYDGELSFNTRNTFIYIVKISNGTVYTITLNDIDGASTYGFDKRLDTFYYCSASAHPTNRESICFFNISNYDEDSTVSASFNLTNLARSINNLSFKGKIEFVDSSTAYYTQIFGIGKIDLSVPGGAVTTVVGRQNFIGSNDGFWNNIYPNIPWGSEFKLFAPYLDGNGTDAWLSWLQDISYDSANNRLILCDYGAQRIRSVNLAPGSNYAVTTLAGTSPTLDTVSGTLNNNFSQPVLNSLKQVGSWNNGINAMPAFKKTNKSFLTSTFKFPISTTIFNNKIYVRTLDTLPYDDLMVAGANLKNFNTYCTTRQLYNNSVTDFNAIITSYPLPNPSSIQIAVSALLSTFINVVNSPSFFTTFESFLQTAAPALLNVSSSGLRNHYAALVGGINNIPKNIYALSGTTIDPDLILDIAKTPSSGFLIPSSYPITIGSSTYQSNSVTNTLTIITNAVTETKNPGDTYAISGYPFIFLGAGSSGLNKADYRYWFVIDPVMENSEGKAIWTMEYGNGDFRAVAVSSGIIKFQGDQGWKHVVLRDKVSQAKIIYYEETLRYLPGIDASQLNSLEERSIKGGLVDIPLIYTFDDAFELPDINNPNRVYKRGIRRTFNLSDLYASNVLKLGINKYYLYGHVIRKDKNPREYYRSEIGEYTINPILTFSLTNGTFSFTNPEIFLNNNRVCKIFGGNENNRIITTPTFSLTNLINTGFFTSERYYPYIYIQSASTIQPETLIISNVLTLGVKPAVGTLTYNNSTKIIEYNQNVANGARGNIEYCTFYVNGSELFRSNGGLVKQLNVINGPELQNNNPLNIGSSYRVSYSFTSAYTYIDNNGNNQTERIVSDRSAEIVVDLRALNASECNDAYLRMIRSATVGGVVDLSKAYFSSSPIRYTIAYNGEYKSLNSHPIRYQIIFASPTGTVSVRNTPTITIDPSVIFLVNDPDAVLLITPTIFTRYCILFNPAWTSSKIPRINIYNINTSKLSKVLLPCATGGNPEAIGTTRVFGLGSIMFDLSLNVNYRINFRGDLCLDQATIFNNAYKSLITAATSGGTVNRQVVSQTIFDTSRTANPPTICYHYLGPYLPKWPMPPAYQVASIALDGTITTGKVSTFNEMFATPGQPMFRDGDPPGIFTIPGNNIFLFSDLDVPIRILPSISSKYAAIIPRQFGINISSSFSLKITLEDSPAYAPVQLPNTDGSIANGYVSGLGVSSTAYVSYSAVFFDLVGGLDYRIEFTKP